MTYDLVLWGATGFTGRLVAEYLVERHPDVSLALAGRSQAKLQAVNTELGRELPILLGDAQDQPSLEAIAKQTKAIITTVGPYWIHGEKLAAACAKLGTHYCDLTGEVPFVRSIIDKHHDEAKRSGARLVPCAGFDSIPSDLGVWQLADYARREHGHGLRLVKAFLGESSGGFSGGTVASMLHMLDRAMEDRAVRRLAADPYALSPDRAHDLDIDGPDQMGVAFDDDLEMWTGPFLMASVNTRVVRRSNALTGFSYGKHFAYREAMSFGKGPKGFALAAGVTAATGGFFGAATLKPVRAYLEKKLPQSGEGPSKEAREKGHFTMRFVAETDGGEEKGGLSKRLRGTVRGFRDPGYAETAKMIAETGVALSRGEGNPEGGVHTTASALGGVLVERLRQAGMVFSVEPG
jgi:short subunit dehydrogenase-like uncharacterized protein